MTLTLRDKEIIAYSEKRIKDKTNMLGADGYYYAEPFVANRHIALSDTFRQKPAPLDGYGLSTPNYDDYPTVGGVGTRRVEYRLYPYLPSGKNGPDTVQTFITVSAAPASNSVEDIEAVRIKPLISPRFSPGQKDAAESTELDRGFELALFPAKDVAGELRADTSNGPIPPNADPSTGSPAEGADNDGMWYVDYENGIVRFSVPPLNGSGGVMNPNNVFGDYAGNTDASGAITMFATYYEYSGEYGSEIAYNFVTVGDGYRSQGFLEGTNHNVVQSALDTFISPEEKGGGTVFLKEGHYVFTDSVIMPEKTRLVGTGGAIVFRPDALPAFIIQDGYSEIEGIEIRNLTPGSATTAGAIEIRTHEDYQELNGIRIVKNDIETATGAPGIGIAPLNVGAIYNNIKITDNIFDGYEYESSTSAIQTIDRGGVVETAKGWDVSNNILGQNTVLGDTNGIRLTSVLTNLEDSVISNNIGDLAPLEISASGNLQKTHITTNTLYTFNIANSSSSVYSFRQLQLLGNIIGVSATSSDEAEIHMSGGGDGYSDISSNYFHNGLIINAVNAGNDIFAVNISNNILLNPATGDCLSITGAGSNELHQANISDNTLAGKINISVGKIYRSNINGNIGIYSTSGGMDLSSQIYNSTINDNTFSVGDITIDPGSAVQAIEYSTIHGNILDSGDFVIGNSGISDSADNIIKCVIDNNVGIHLSTYGNCEYTLVNGNILGGSGAAIRFKYLNDSVVSDNIISVGTIDAVLVANSIVTENNGVIIDFNTYLSAAITDSIISNNFMATSILAYGLEDSSINNNSTPTMTISNGIVRSSVSNNNVITALTIANASAAAAVDRSNVVNNIGGASSTFSINSATGAASEIVSSKIGENIFNTVVFGGNALSSNAATLYNSNVYENVFDTFTIGSLSSTSSFGAMFNSSVSKNLLNGDFTINHNMTCSKISNNVINASNFSIKGSLEECEIKDGYFGGTVQICESLASGTAVSKSIISGNIVSSTFEIGEVLLNGTVFNDSVFTNNVISGNTDIGDSLNTNGSNVFYNSIVSENYFGGDTTIGTNIQSSDPTYALNSSMFVNNIAIGQIDFGNSGRTRILNTIVDSEISGCIISDTLYIYGRSSECIIVNNKIGNTLEFDSLYRCILSNNKIDAFLFLGLSFTTAGEIAVEDSIINNNYADTLYVATNLSASGSLCAKKSLFSNNVIGNFNFGGISVPHNQISLYGVEILGNTITSGFTSRGRINNSEISNNMIYGNSTIWGMVDECSIKDGYFGGTVQVCRYLTSGTAVNSSIISGNIASSTFEIGEALVYGDALSNSLFNNNIILGAVDIGDSLNNDGSNVVNMSSVSENFFGSTLSIGATLSTTTAGYALNNSKFNNNFTVGAITIASSSRNESTDTNLNSEIIGCHTTDTLYLYGRSSKCLISNNNINIIRLDSAKECALSNNRVAGSLYIGETFNISEESAIEDTLIDGNDAVYLRLGIGMGTTTNGLSIKNSVCTNNISDYIIIGKSDRDPSIVTCNGAKICDNIINLNFVSYGRINNSDISRNSTNYLFYMYGMIDECRIEDGYFGNEAHICESLTSGTAVNSSIISGNSFAGAVAVGESLASGTTLSNSIIDSNNFNSTFSTGDATTSSNVISHSIISKNVIEGASTFGTALTGTTGYLLNASLVTGNRFNGQVNFGKSDRTRTSTTYYHATFCDNSVWDNDIYFYGKWENSIFNRNNLESNVYLYGSVVNTSIVENYIQHNLRLDEGITSSETLYYSSLSNNTINGDMYIGELVASGSSSVIEGSLINENVIVGSLFICDDFAGSVECIVDSSICGNIVETTNEYLYICKDGNPTYSFIDNSNISNNVAYNFSVGATKTTTGGFILRSIISNNNIINELKIGEAYTSTTDGYILEESVVSNNIVETSATFGNSGRSVSRETYYLSIIDGNSFKDLYIYGLFITSVLSNNTFELKNAFSYYRGLGTNVVGNVNTSSTNLISGIHIPPTNALNYPSTKDVGDICTNNSTGKLETTDGTNWYPVVNKAYSVSPSSDTLTATGNFTSSYTIPGSSLLNGSVIKVRAGIQQTTNGTGHTIIIYVRLTDGSYTYDFDCISYTSDGSPCDIVFDASIIVDGGGFWYGNFSSLAISTHSPKQWANVISSGSTFDATQGTTIYVRMSGADETLQLESLDIQVG